jgi:hypothetical protein
MERNIKRRTSTAGTYVWMVAGKAIDGSIIKKQGTVVLIR